MEALGSGSDTTGYVRCIANPGHAFNVADTDMAGSILRWDQMVKSDRYRWFHGFTAPCSHVGAAWMSDIGKTDFLAFKPFNLSPHNHV
jgi:hypothetical protein